MLLTKHLEQMTNQDKNTKLKKMILLFKDLTSENQDILRDFALEYQKEVDRLEGLNSVLRDQLIKVRNGSY